MPLYRLFELPFFSFLAILSSIGTAVFTRLRSEQVLSLRHRRACPRVEVLANFGVGHRYHRLTRSLNLIWRLQCHFAALRRPDNVLLCSVLVTIPVILLDQHLVAHLLSLAGRERRRRFTFKIVLHKSLLISFGNGVDGVLDYLFIGKLDLIDTRGGPSLAALCPSCCPVRW